MVPSSNQGEHIFNALDSLALEQIPEMNKQINQAKPSRIKEKEAAIKAVNHLETLANQLKKERDHPDFRTAPKGDPANAQRYGNFKKDTELNVKKVMTGSPSEHTAGYTSLNRMLDNLDYYTIDQVAHKSGREQLSALRQREFDVWYAATKGLMHSTFTALRDAALATSRTRDL
ncbi:hypothetical protein [Cylindrospermum sp. FACHB-282]|uniref:hypothetical protein n=1 Tax=Cylindrospermum sp. FACHB-282 TaxID=2692794 RepID=UPI001684C24A|nr:hypothetical protein [Cylindrospermum sp. FACHB-282]MBD2385832.1 hypothetical protein [Cylindrospermum sp. FACHB-282]